MAANSFSAITFLIFFGKTSPGGATLIHLCRRKKKVIKKFLSFFEKSFTTPKTASNWKKRRRTRKFCLSGKNERKTFETNNFLTLLLLCHWKLFTVEILVLNASCWLLMHMQNFSYTVVGSGGGTNGRAMAFYLSRPPKTPKPRFLEKSQNHIDLKFIIKNYVYILL